MSEHFKVNWRDNKKNPREITTVSTKQRFRRLMRTDSVTAFGQEPYSLGIIAFNSWPRHRAVENLLSIVIRLCIIKRTRK